jgi:type IV pilus assembly protein PilY1
MHNLMLKRLGKLILGSALWMLLLGAVVHAEVAQEPMLTRSSSVQPNLVLMFDDSGSMDDQYVYQYGGSQGGNGRTGPGVGGKSATCPTNPSITNTCTYNEPTISAVATVAAAAQWVSGTTYVQGDVRISPANSKTYKRNDRPYDNKNLTTHDPSSNAASDRWDLVSTSTTSSPYYELSPDVNRLYYDPRILYRVRINSTGGLATVGPTSTSTFYVFLYKSGTADTIVWPGSGNDPTLLSSYLSSYTPAFAALATGASTGLSYPQAIATGTGPLPKFIKRTDCNGGVEGGSCSLDEERQNYANWKKYHSNRLDLVKTGLGYAFRNVGATIRLGWSRINGLEGGALDSGVSIFNQTSKDGFYAWLYRQVNPGNTPNRLALKAVGEYYSRADNSGPWASTPNPNSTTTSPISASAPDDTVAIRATHASCRRSYSMLVTDGYYNDDTSTIGVGDFDYSTSIPTVTGTTNLGATLTFSYDGRTRPYAQSGADTFSDVAMKYWVTDLRPDLANRVKVIPDKTVGGTIIKGNESFWQNMSFYAVGLGIYGSLPQTPATLADLSSGSTAWPTPTTNNETAVDDMWHATINSRGRFLSAKNADDLSEAIEGMLADINKLESSQSGVAVSTANLTIGTRKYTPRYETGSWKGNVIARNLDPNTGVELSTAWQVVGTSTTAPFTAYNGIPTANARTIVAWTGSAAEAFANNASITGNMTAPVTDNLINYLRGDQSNEGSNGLALYRPREVKLGDIVNSAPAFVKGEIDLQYENLPTGTAGAGSYRQFFTDKAARTEGAVFVGANDGMLHAFRESNGVEVFAYIPRAVLPNLHLLANKNYTHRYFVDGPNVETDAYFSTLGQWRNLLLGTTGAGAKAVYALDVTNPVSMTAASVKWEINPSTSTNFSELGHVLSDVQSGYTPSGNWVAIFGNGYDSPTGVARLYIVNLLTGEYIKHIDVAGTAGGNGLGAVRLVRDDKQQIIGAYAGDLKGKLWKFDLKDPSISNWRLGLNNTPLYDAGTTKPITAAPAVIPNPTGGNVIAFATGKLFENSDLTTTAGQSVYGVWDSIPFGSPTTAMTALALTNLVQQTIALSSTATRTVTTTDLTQITQTVSYYSVSKNTFTYSATTRGWYIDLPNSGQRTVYPLDKLSNRYIGVDTVSPINVNVTDPCLQGAQGQGWLYFIDGLTGGGPDEAILDTNGDGQITTQTTTGGGAQTNTGDNTSSGVSTTADGRNISVKVESRSSSTQTTYANLGGGSGGSTLVRLTCAMLGTCGGSGGGSTNPTSLGVFKSREWRQLFMR